MQGDKITGVQSHIEDVVYHSKETYKSILTSAKEDKNAKDNKCCIILLVSIAILFLILFLINYERS